MNGLTASTGTPPCHGSCPTAASSPSSRCLGGGSPATLSWKSQMAQPQKSFAQADPWYLPASLTGRSSRPETPHDRAVAGALLLLHRASAGWALWLRECLLRAAGLSRGGPRNPLVRAGPGGTRTCWSGWAKQRPVLFAVARPGRHSGLVARFIGDPRERVGGWLLWSLQPSPLSALDFVVVGIGLTWFPLVELPATPWFLVAVSGIRLRIVSRRRPKDKRREARRVQRQRQN